MIQLQFRLRMLLMPGFFQCRALTVTGSEMAHGHRSFLCSADGPLAEGLAFLYEIAAIDPEFQQLYCS
jgi:hypothetical protein